MFAAGFFFLLTSGVSALYSPLREYSGQTFFDRWDFYDNVDNTTWGNVTFVDRPSASSQSLGFVNEQGNAILRVDNETFIDPAAPGFINRNTVKITSQDAYPIGSLILIDVAHIPVGCSVWPSFWTLGTDLEWPHAGEIDIIEGINRMSNNQMSLHSDFGCMKDTSASSAELGRTLNANCGEDRGCSTAETKANSFGDGFNAAGGGVFAMQFDVAGIWFWFWSRPNMPASILNTTSSPNLDTTDWGTPSASYPATTCNITQFFRTQKLILDITLCGDWAAIPSLYRATCPDPAPARCVDNIYGTGSPAYDNAWFEIRWIKTFLATADVPVTSSSSTADPVLVTETQTQTGAGAGADVTGTSAGTRESSNSGGTVCATWAALGIVGGVLFGVL